MALVKEPLNDDAKLVALRWLIANQQQQEQTAGNKNRTARARVRRAE
jgi:hypothetical protein